MGFTLLPNRKPTKKVIVFFCRSIFYIFSQCVRGTVAPSIEWRTLICGEKLRGIGDCDLKRFTSLDWNDKPVARVRLLTDKTQHFFGKSFSEPKRTRTGFLRKVLPEKLSSHALRPPRAGAASRAKASPQVASGASEVLRRGPSLTAFALAQPYVRLGDEGRSIEESGIRVPLGLAYRHRFPVPRGSCSSRLRYLGHHTRCPRGRAIGIFSNQSLPDKSHYQKSFTIFFGNLSEKINPTPKSFPGNLPEK